MNIIPDLSIAQIIGLYIAIGLCKLLSALRAGLKDQFEREEIRERLGVIVLITVFAWPYNLTCWIFSWDIWLKPVREIIPPYVTEWVSIGVAIFLLLLMQGFGLVELRSPIGLP